MLCVVDAQDSGLRLDRHYISISAEEPSLSPDNSTADGPGSCNMISRSRLERTKKTGTMEEEVGERLSFVVDKGSESEFHLDVDLCAEHTQQTSTKQLTIEVPLAQVVLELERVYLEEKLPEWRQDSFLAVAAALMADDDEDEAQGSAEGMLEEADPGEICNAEAVHVGGLLASISTMPSMQIQQLIHDFSETLEDMHTAGFMPVALVHMPRLSRGNGAEDDILARCSLLMRDAGKGTAIIEVTVCI